MRSLTTGCRTYEGSSRERVPCGTRRHCGLQSVGDADAFRVRYAACSGESGHSGHSGHSGWRSLRATLRIQLLSVGLGLTSVRHTAGGTGRHAAAAEAYCDRRTSWHWAEMDRTDCGDSVRFAAVKAEGFRDPTRPGVEAAAAGWLCATNMV